MYVCAGAPSLPRMRSLRSLTRPNAKPTSGLTVDHGFVGRSATSAAPLRRVQCAIPPHPRLPCRRVHPDEPTSKCRSTVRRKTTMGSPGKCPLCASGTKAALPRPKREPARFPQPMDGLPKCSAQFAQRCLGVRASLRTSAGRPTGKHRLHCTSIDPAVRTAAGCGPSQRRRLLARGSGKYFTPTEVLGLLTSEARVCGRYIRKKRSAPPRQMQLASSTRGLISIAIALLSS